MFRGGSTAILLVFLTAGLFGLQRETSNPYTSPEDEAAGARLYRTRCARCHAFDGTGGRGPALTRGEFRYGSTDADLFRTLSFGIPTANMPNLDLTDDRVWQVVTFVRSLASRSADELRGDPGKGERLFRGKGFCLQCHVVNGEGGRFGPELSGIGWLRTPQFLRESIMDPDREVEPRYWSVRAVDQHGTVINGLRVNEDTYSVQVMDIQENLYSLWKSDLRELEVKKKSGMIPYSGTFSATELDDLVAYATQSPNDAHAIDTRTGRAFWSYSRRLPEKLNVCCGLVNRGFAILGDKLYMGTLDAHLVALDLKTGALIWDVEVEDYKTGHSVTVAPLVVKDKIIVGMAGGEYGVRGFLDAYDAETGKLKWHFQFTPHDVWDWDAVQIPVLADLEFQGRQRKLMLWANRNAFYYVLDRETGEFLHGTPFAKQTWAKGLDPKGRPMVKEGMKPSKKGTLVYPGVGGGTNWFSPSFSPQTGLYYVSSSDYSNIYYTNEAEYIPGEEFLGSFGQGNPDDPGYGAVRALVPQTGELKWEYKLHSRARAGILTTAGNVLFSGTPEGQFFALDAASGKELWRLSIGGAISAAPMTYLSEGKQLVSIASGNAIFTFGLED